MKNGRFLLIAACASVVCLGVSTTLHGGMINHWKLDEPGFATTAVDSTGSLNATLVGDAAFVNDPTRGQVLELDGSGDYAHNTTGVPFITDIDHTVTLWVNHADLTNTSQRWLSWGAYPTRYFLGPYSGSVTGGFVDKTASFSVTPTLNTWQHWAFVRDGNTSKLYVDGNLVGTDTDLQGGSITIGNGFRIGRQYSSNTEYLNGRMSDLAIWNEPLEEWQIRNAMNLGVDNYFVPEPSSVVLSLTAALGMFVLLRLRSGRRRRPTNG